MCARGVHKLDILRYVDLAALLGAANVVERDVQVAETFRVEVFFKLV